MQVHAVPEEERAFDSTGKTRLPWSYEYADESLNRRRPAEEKGPFGTARRRRLGSSRTATPAKKEDPNVIYADKIFDDYKRQLKDQTYVQEQQQQHRSSISSSVFPNTSRGDPEWTELTSRETTSQSGPTSGGAPQAREPTEVMLYGFQPEKQYAAISHFERISRGMICEDYPRDPPDERLKFGTGLGKGRANLTRPLTREESQKARHYAGGECWIKVTFDSVDAAERACYYSPAEIGGYRVHAELYRGVGPREDIPIPILAHDRGEAILGSQQHRRGGSNPLTSSISVSSLPPAAMQKGQSTLPRSHTTSDLSLESGGSPSSSSTISSATAIAYPDLSKTPTQPTLRTSTTTEPSRKSQDELYCHRIPTARRAVLLPAEQALLPQASWSQRWIAQMPLVRWFSGDIIGNEVPRLEDGKFDFAKASFYWRFWYWIDSLFGTDLCGLREE